MLKSLLLKGILLAATAAVVLWIGWPMPSPAPSDSEPQGAAEVTQGSPAVLQGDAALSEDIPPGRPARDGRSGPTTAGSPAVPVRERLDINRATLEELQTLPGIGQVLARRVIERRSARGSFHTVDDLLEVKGIGVHRLKRLRPFLTAGKGSPDTGTARQSGRGGLPEKRKL